MAKGFVVLAGSVMPSHAHVECVDFGGTVSVHGMIVRHNDLIHADRHGAVVIPHDVARKVEDRKSTRLNSSHQIISYAVFCLKKKKKINKRKSSYTNEC